MNPLEPGVYINLPEEIYFGQDALGSSDLKTLLREPANWWYGSRHNPLKAADTDTDARILGRALHALILEGTQAYESRFAVEPDLSGVTDLLVTKDQIKDALEQIEEGCTKGFKVKGEYVRLANDKGLGYRTQDILMSDHAMKVEQWGFTPIKHAQDIAMRHMAELVENHPDLGPGIRNGLSEVSIFWRRDDQPDILFRARLDLVSEHFTLDLKTLSNWKNRTIADMARRQIEEFEYDIQRRFYDEARSWMRYFIDEGQVFNTVHYLDPQTQERWSEQERVDLENDPDQTGAAKLKAIAAQPTWKWVWLFYQLRDDAKAKAPIIVPRFHDPQLRCTCPDQNHTTPRNCPTWRSDSEIWLGAERKIERALENYRDYVSRFGFKTPWCHIEDLIDLDDADLAGLRFKEVV